MAKKVSQDNLTEFWRKASQLIKEYVSEHSTAGTGSGLTDEQKDLLDVFYTNGFMFGGVAVPTTAPTDFESIPKVAYIACTEGTYTNFGNLALTSGEVAVLCCYNSGERHTYKKTTVAMIPTVKDPDADDNLDVVRYFKVMGTAPEGEELDRGNVIWVLFDRSDTLIKNMVLALEAADNTLNEYAGRFDFLFQQNGGSDQGVSHKLYDKMRFTHIGNQLNVTFQRTTIQLVDDFQGTVTYGTINVVITLDDSDGVTGIPTVTERETMFRMNSNGDGTKFLNDMGTYTKPDSAELPVDLIATGDGTKFLADDGTYKTVQTSGGGSEPEPEPTKYTLTITPVPSDATVTINGSVRTSIEVESDTSVTYKVEKTGYITKSDTVIVTETKTITVTLEEKATEPSEGTVIYQELEDMKVYTLKLEQSQNNYAAAITGDALATLKAIRTDVYAKTPCLICFDRGSTSPVALMMYPDTIRSGNDHDTTTKEDGQQYFQLASVGATWVSDTIERKLSLVFKVYPSGDIKAAWSEKDDRIVTSEYVRWHGNRAYFTEGSGGTVTCMLTQDLIAQYNEYRIGRGNTLFVTESMEFSTLFPDAGIPDTAQFVLAFAGAVDYESIQGVTGDIVEFRSLNSYNGKSLYLKMQLTVSGSRIDATSIDKALV